MTGRRTAAPVSPLAGATLTKSALINVLCELVDCPDCKLCAPLRQRAEHLLNEHYGHVSQ